MAPQHLRARLDAVRLLPGHHGPGRNDGRLAGGEALPTVRGLEKRASVRVQQRGRDVAIRCPVIDDEDGSHRRQTVPAIAPTVCAGWHRRDVCTRTQTPATGGSTIVSMVSGLLISLIVLWLVGIAASYTLGGLIHVLLVAPVVVVLLRVLDGRNVIRG